MDLDHIHVSNLLTTNGPGCWIYIVARLIDRISQAINISVSTRIEMNTACANMFFCLTQGVEQQMERKNRSPISCLCNLDSLQKRQISISVSACVICGEYINLTLITNHLNSDFYILYARENITGVQPMCELVDFWHGIDWQKQIWCSRLNMWSTYIVKLGPVLFQRF